MPCAGPHQGRGGAILCHVLQHSIKHVFVQFRGSRSVVSRDNAQELADLLLHLGASVAEVKVHQFSDDVSSHQLSSGLQAVGEGLEKCDAVFGGSRGASETVALMDMSSGERRRLGRIKWHTSE